MKGKESQLDDSDLAISREVEQEVLDILDGKIPADFYTGLRQAKKGRTVPMEQVLEGPEP